MNTVEENAAWEEIDLREYFNILMKRKWLIIGLTAASIIIAAVVSFFVLSPIYETESYISVSSVNRQKSNDTIKYIEREDSIDLEVIDALSSMPNINLNTTAKEIKRPALLEKVVDKLDLDSRKYSLSSLSKAINVNIIKDTNLVEIKVADTDPALAAKIANTLTDEFLQYVSESNQERMSKSVRFLTGQFETGEKNYKSALAELQEFESQKRNIPYLNNRLAVLTEKLRSYSAQESDLEVNLQKFLSIKGQIEERLKEVPEYVVSSRRTLDLGPALSLLTQGGTKGEAPMDEKIESINPVYQNLQTRLEETIINISETRSLLNSVREQRKEIESEIHSLRRELAEKETYHRQLVQEVDRYEQTYNLLAQKITETKIAESVRLGETNMQVVSYARVPEFPVKPNKKLNVAIAGVLGIMVSVMLAFLLEFFGNTAETQKT